MHPVLLRIATLSAQGAADLAAPQLGKIVMGKRPAHLKPPAHLSKNTPVPKPEPLRKSATDPLGADPTRFGDWTLKGIAVDF